MKHPLRTYLEKKGMSQAAFALEANTSRQTIWRILAGKSDCSLGTLRRVAKATDNKVSFIELVKFDDKLKEEVR